MRATPAPSHPASRSIAAFTASLNKFKVGAPEQRDLATALAKIKPDIVNVK